jgi:YidC/Oxa1 family membrane protein insertase
MTTEKRVLVAAILSSLFLVWYSQFIVKPTQKVPPLKKEIPQQEMIASGRPTSPYPIIDEDVIVLESEELALEIGETTAAVRAATLKRFADASKLSALVLKSQFPTNELLVDGARRTWKLVSSSSSQANFSSTDEHGNNYYISYEIDRTNPLFNIKLTASILNGEPKISLASTWLRAAEIKSRDNILEIMIVTEKKPKEYSHKKYAGEQRSEKIVPRGTLLLTISERYFCQSIRPSKPFLGTSILPSRNGVIVTESTIDVERSGQAASAELLVYLGPRDYFYLKRSGFDNAFPIGMLGKIGLALLLFLGWMASLTKNYGVSIILLSGMITTITAPFTLIGIRSMKKLQELKPHVDRITAQHKSDPTKANKEIFALYKEHKVSPMSGCLPMLLQMPIFIALFQAISHYVNLRGASFLWIKDLSLPDRLASLPVTIPFLGNELNVLPIIMAAVMYFQTKFSQPKGMPGQSNPTAQMLSGPMMPILFGFMFYHFSSGLVLYWLTNSLLSLVWFRLAK